jgi:hypothetical protein
MAIYKLFPNGVIRYPGEPNQEIIPESEANPQWQEYLAWVAAGNTPDPADMVSVAGPRHITKLAFRNRFITSEKIAIDIASLDDATKPLSDPARIQAATVRSILNDLADSRYIDLDRQDTINGVNYFVSLGVITAERANQILTGSIQVEEQMDYEKT